LAVRSGQSAVGSPQWAVNTVPKGPHMTFVSTALNDRASNPPALVSTTLDYMNYTTQRIPLLYQCGA